MMAISVWKQSLLLPLLYAGAQSDNFSLLQMSKSSIKNQRGSKGDHLTALLEQSQSQLVRLGNVTVEADVPSMSGESVRESAVANTAVASGNSKSSADKLFKDSASHSIEAAVSTAVAPSVAGHIFSSSPIQRVAVKTGTSATASPSDNVESSIGDNSVAAVVTPTAAVSANEKGASSLEEPTVLDTVLGNPGLIDATKPKEAAWFEAFDQSESTYTKDADKSVGNAAEYLGGEMDIEPPVPYEVDSAKRAGWFQETPSGGATGAWQTYPVIETVSVGPHAASNLAWHETEQGFMPDYNAPVKSETKNSARWFDEAVANYDSFGRKMPPKVALQSLASDESEDIEAAKAKPANNDQVVAADNVQVSEHGESVANGTVGIVAGSSDAAAKAATDLDASAQTASASSENATSSKHEGPVEGESSWWQTVKDGAKHVAHAVVKGATHVAKSAKHAAITTHAAVKDAVEQVRNSNR